MVTVMQAVHRVSWEPLSGQDMRLVWRRAFYITARAPVEDDVAYSDILGKECVFCLPGSVVNMNGYLRASLTANDDMIERALPIFAAARQKCSKQSRSDPKYAATLSPLTRSIGE
jgi:hypothetical protein